MAFYPHTAELRSQTDIIAAAPSTARLAHPAPPWRDAAWDESPLGHPSGWPGPLRTAAALAADSPLPMWVAWGESLAVVCNAAFADLLGAAPEQGAPLRRVLDGRWDSLWPLVDKALSGCGATCTDLPLAGQETADAARRLGCSLLPLRDEAGAVRGLVCTAWQSAQPECGAAPADAVDRHAQDSAERYRLARMATYDAIWDWRLDDGHVIWNAALHDLFGHALEQTSADWWLEHIHPDDRAGIDHAIHAVIDGSGTRWSAEYRFLRADGGYAEISDRGTVLRDAQGRPLRMIGAMRDLSEHRAAQRALYESERLFRTMFESIDQGFSVIEFLDGPHGPLSDYVHVMANPAYAVHTGIENVVGQRVREMVPLEAGAWVEIYREVLVSGKPIRFQRELEHTGRHLELSALRIEPAERRQVAVLFQDITPRHQAERALRTLNDTLERRVADEVAERVRTEDALRQSQKMEAVGQLTGGIAHDFNNMLAVISNALELLGRRLPPGDERTPHYLAMAKGGVRRAADLTQRLLAFARQQPLRPAALSVNALVEGMSELLRHSLGAPIALELALSENLWTTFADPGQLENAIVNLVVNARDAMDDGGRLRIATARRSLDAQQAGALGALAAGDYVVVEVADTGSGMTPQVIGRAFEPFFTTKEVGRGTGLGLSQVYGFVRQSGGTVTIESAPGQGSTVRIFLPRHMAAPGKPEPETRVPGPATGCRSELVLVVDDEAEVRTLLTEMLDELGYGVLCADGGGAALEVLDAHPDIGLLLTDVVMPGMNGRKLADEALRRRPGLKLLFTTGYTRNLMVDNGVLDRAVQILPKPFSIEELASAVRTQFDAA